jgi:hypothetical protein
MLTAIEGGVLGDYTQVAKPYLEISKKITEYLKKSGSYKKPETYTDGTIHPKDFKYQLDLSGENLFNLYMHIFDEATKMGVASLKEGGGSVLRLLNKELNPFSTE